MLVQTDDASINLRVELDASLAVAGVARVDGVATWRDPRLLRAGGGWHTVADVAQRTVLLRLEHGRMDYGSALPEPAGWLPVATRSGVRFVRLDGALTVLAWEGPGTEARVVRAAASPAWAARVVGGSPGLQIAGGYLFVVRELATDPLPYGRTGHRFVLLDEGLCVAAWSPPFRFGDGTRERCGGLARHADDVVLSVELEHRGVGLALVALDEIRELLRDLK